MKKMAGNSCEDGKIREYLRNACPRIFFLSTFENAVPIERYTTLD